jgi:hypothetical protein
MIFKITFPKDKKEAIILGLQDANATVEKHNRSKKFGIAKKILSMHLKAPVNNIARSSYTIVNDNEIIWNYNILGEGFVKDEILSGKIKKIILRDYGSDVHIEHIKEVKI